MAGPVTRREHTELPNGLVIVAEEVTAAPVFTAMLVAESGSRFDPEGRAGLAGMTGRLLVEGTETRTSDEIAVAVDSLGGSLDVMTGYETTAVVVGGLSDHLGGLMDLLADVVIRPSFTEDLLADGVRRQLAEIAEDDDQAFEVCRRELSRAIFRGHNRQHPVGGVAETVGAITLEDVGTFHRDHFGPGRAVLAIAGDHDVLEMVETGTSCLADWRSAGAPVEDPPQPTRQRERRESTVEMDARQVHVSMGNLAIARSDPSYYATSIMDVVLGDSAGFGSRLATKLREERGLAYVIESDTCGSAGLEPGVFWAYTATSPEQVDALVAGVLDELRLMRAEPPTSEELESAVAYLRGRDLLERETTELRAGRLVHAERHRLGLDYDERYASLLGSVTREDVLEAARRVIDPDNCSFVRVGRVSSD